MNFEAYYQSLKPKIIPIGDASIAVRKCGSGPNLCLIHGFPTHGYTWRKILPFLSKKFTCYVLDLPGLGDSQWTSTTDFKSETHADRVIQLFDLLKVKNYSLIAHDSGATVARIIALKRTKAVKKMVLFNTEIPKHRPPWIPLYQTIGLLPLIPWSIRQVMKSKLF
ncbi:MAG: alpha/beta fold hydrolase, partial [Chitinophagales bacterium]